MRTAIRDTLGSPSAWAVAAAGFMVRGGILVLAVPVLSLPTPVGVTLLVPPLSVTTSGISSVYVPQLLALGTGALVVVAVAVVSVPGNAGTLTRPRARGPPALDALGGEVLVGRPGVVIAGVSVGRVTVVVVLGVRSPPVGGSAAVLIRL